MRWCRPRVPVEPMYMPGRLRTASRPSRTVMSFAPYEALPLEDFFAKFLFRRARAGGARAVSLRDETPTPAGASARIGALGFTHRRIAARQVGPGPLSVTKCPQIAR